MENLRAIEFIKSLMAQGDPTAESGVYMGRSLPEMAELWCQQTGVPIKGGTAATLNNALVTTDFGDVPAGVMQMIANNNFDLYRQSYEALTGHATTQNFGLSYITSMKAAGLLDEVKGGAEIPLMGDLEIGAEEYFLKTYAGRIPISRQDMINDNVQALFDKGRYAIRTTKRTWNTLFFRHLLANGTMADGEALFSAAHGNLLTGSSSALDADSLQLAMQTLRGMTDADGQPYGIQPKNLLVGPTNETTAAKLIRDMASVDADRLNLVVDPLAELSSLGGTSTNFWVFPDPNVVPVINTVGLVGKTMAPDIEGKVLSGGDTYDFKIRIDAAIATASTYAVKSVGA